VTTFYTPAPAWPSSGARVSRARSRPGLARLTRDEKRKLHHREITSAGDSAGRRAGTPVERAGTEVQQNSTATGMEISRHQWTSVDG
jgi:hypothetical protein